MRAGVVLSLVLVAATSSAQQPLAERLRAAGTRTVAFSTSARAEVCGDGRSYLSDGLGGSRTTFYGQFDSRTLTLRPCVHGPMRVTIRMVEGVPSHLRTTAGSLDVLGDSVLDLGMVRAAEAGAFLRELVRAGEGRVAEQAFLPLFLVDSAPRWEILADAARDSTRMLRYRRRASDLLARGAASTLGAIGDADDPAVSERRAAVSALARRRPRDRYQDPVPDLLEIARANRHADARAAALYELGHTADPRAVSLMAAMLGVK